MVSKPTLKQPSEQSSEHFLDTKQASKSQKKKPNMAFRLGRGGGAGRRRGRLVANAEVLETMQQIQAILEEIGRAHV